MKDIVSATEAGDVHELSTRGVTKKYTLLQGDTLIDLRELRKCRTELSARDRRLDDSA